MLKMLLKHYLYELRHTQLFGCRSHFGMYRCCLPRKHRGDHIGFIRQSESWRTEDER